MFLLSQLHFIELNVDISILSELQKICTEHVAFCDFSNFNSNCTNDVNPSATEDI